MRLILDSISENQKGERIATFECGDEMISINEMNMPSDFIDKLFDGVIVEGELLDGILSNPIILEDESKSKMMQMRSRLDRLRNRNKK